MGQGSPAGEFAISRLDLASVGTHGWQVRLQRRGVRYQRYFSDQVWGGTRGALLRAKQYRDRVVARLDQHDVSADGAFRQRARTHSATSRNQSGVVGVVRVRNLAANGVYYESWQATWSPEPGRRKCVRFSVLRYGEEKAFELACAARREAVGAVPGRRERERGRMRRNKPGDGKSA